MISIIPTFTLFVIVSQRLLGDLNRFIAARTSLIYYIPSISLTKKILEKNNDLKLKIKRKKTIPFEYLKSDIVFKNVYFSYGKNKALFKNLNFSIPKGKITALVGESGSGKSTISDLLLGLYSADEGEIYINGNNIAPNIP